MPKTLDKEGPKTGSTLKPTIFSKIKSFLQKDVFKKLKLNKLNNQDNVVKSRDIINNIDSFSTKTLEDIMIPRSDIIAVSLDIELEEINKLIIKNSCTRILVYKENIDNIIGFLHIKDLFAVIVEKQQFDLKKSVRKHIVATPSMKLMNLLAQMQKNRTHIAIIVDEYGCTDGLVTMEDLIEEVFGDIDDEHDDDINENKNYKIVKNGIIIVDARFKISELEDLIKISLSRLNDEFDTIAGLVIAKSGFVPQKGQVVFINDNVSAKILDATPRTIKQMKIKYKPTNERSIS